MIEALKVTRVLWNESTSIKRGGKEKRLRILSLLSESEKKKKLILKGS